jgi:hypothetical protein
LSFSTFTLPVAAGTTDEFKNVSLLVHEAMINTSAMIIIAEKEIPLF